MTDKREIYLWPFPCADGTWGVSYKRGGEVESLGHASKEDALQHIIDKPDGEFARFVIAPTEPRKL